MTIERRRGVALLALIALFMGFIDATIVNLTLAQLASQPETISGTALPARHRRRARA